MKEHNKHIIITSIISGVILIVALVALLSLSPSAGKTVTVEGIAEVNAVPDLVSVYFSIESKGTTASNAREMTEEIYSKLLSEIVSSGFEESDLQTQGFNVYPNYNWVNNIQKQDGYIASQSLRLELSEEEFDKIEEVIDAGVNSGAGISYINFELSQEAQNIYKAQALELASEDARIKADAVAAGFGKKAGRLVSVQVSNFGYYPWAVYASEGYSEDAALARESVTKITPSEQEINAIVSATFKI